MGLGLAGRRLHKNPDSLGLFVQVDDAKRRSITSRKHGLYFRNTMHLLLVLASQQPAQTHIKLLRSRTPTSHIASFSIRFTSHHIHSPPSQHFSHLSTYHLVMFGFSNGDYDVEAARMKQLFALFFSLQTPGARLVKLLHQTDATGGVQWGVADLKVIQSLSFLSFGNLYFFRLCSRLEN